MAESKELKDILKRLQTLETENNKLRRKIEDNNDEGAKSKIMYVKKENSLPVFKGEGKGIGAVEFITELTDYLEDCNLSGKEKAIIIKEKVQGDAYVDLCNGLSREDMKDSDKIMRMFEELFCKTVPIEELMKDLWSINQTKHESVSEYHRS